MNYSQFRVLGLIGSLAATSVCHATWTETFLTPAGATTGYASAAGGSQQGGYAHIGGQNHAGIWSGTAGSWVDLNPTAQGIVNSQVYGISGGLQGGISMDNVNHMWA